MNLFKSQIFFLIFLSLHFILMLACYVTGIEPIYRHITPFYATLTPLHKNLFLSTLLPLALLVTLTISISKMNKYKKVLLIISMIGTYFLTMTILDKDYRTQQILKELILIGISLGFLLSINRNIYNTTSKYSQIQFYRLKFLFITYLFLIILSISIASLRNGFSSIAEPFTRSKYEYAGDIGITQNIFKLLQNYHNIQSDLSLHGKLAPPGILILLWLSSYIFGRAPLNLAIFTIIFGSSAIFTLHLWAKELSKENQLVNPILTCILYVVTPGILIFTATASEILYMPILFLTLYLFEKSLNDHSPIFICLAGISFAVLSFFKFTLLSIAIYFLLKGVTLLLTKKSTILQLIKLAFLMFLCFIGFYIGLYLLTGYRSLRVFFQAQSLFMRDLGEIEMISPRYPLWCFKFFNIWAWLYYSGVATAIGFISSLFHKKSWKNPLFYTLLITFLILNLTYIAPGEGERSSLYIYPFILLQSFLFWNNKTANSPTLLNSILIFQIFQSVLTECLFYTYW